MSSVVIAMLSSALATLVITTVAFVLGVNKEEKLMEENKE